MESVRDFHVGSAASKAETHFVINLKKWRCAFEDFLRININILVFEYPNKKGTDSNGTKAVRHPALLQFKYIDLELFYARWVWVLTILIICQKKHKINADFFCTYICRRKKERENEPSLYAVHSSAIYVCLTVMHYPESNFAEPWNVIVLSWRVEAENNPICACTPVNCLSLKEPNS